MENEPIKSIRPSRSERPGFPRALATLMVDPAYWIFRGIAAVVEGITTAILKSIAARKDKKTKAKGEE